MSSRYLIVITGIDGSGKTTQADMLVESLKKDGREVSYVWSRWVPSFLRPLVKKLKKDESKRPENTSDNIIALKKRKQNILKNPVIQWFWLGAFFIDYGLQIFVKIRIRFILKKQIIISDRIFYDSLIDQVIGLGESKGWLINSLDSFWMRIFFPKPDMVFYIDCPEEIAFQRKQDIFTPDIKHHRDRRKLYLKLTEKYHWIKIDGTLSVDEIANQIKGRVNEGFGI
jgi:dTMP kinase